MADDDEPRESLDPADPEAEQQDGNGWKDDPDEGGVEPQPDPVDSPAEYDEEDDDDDDEEGQHDSATETDTEGDDLEDSAAGVSVTHRKGPSVTGISTGAGDVTIVGGDLYGGTVERPQFRPPPSRDLERARALFVEPRGYRQVLDTQLDPSHPRVFLVHGPDHCGKRTCAANLAQELLLRRPSEEGAVATIQRYVRGDRSEISLADAITAEELPSRAVVLLHDCFERNVRPEELEAASIGELRAALADADSFLVLTGELGGKALLSASAIQLDAQVDDRLHDVFRTNVDYSIAHEGLALYPEQRDRLLEMRSWQKLIPFLVTPFHIAEFCKKLRELVGAGTDDESLLALPLEAAKAVSIVGRQAGRAWFDTLDSSNQKLFGPLVYLFGGAERSWLEQLGGELVRRLRADGLEWLLDPRQLGLEDTLEGLQLVDRDGRLEFTDRAYEREIRRQVTNRHQLLWDAMSEASDPALLPAEAESWKRQALGAALGRLGPHDPDRFVEALEKIAKERDRRRAVIPSYALQEMVRSGAPPDAELALRVLGGWVRSRDSRLMWAAAAGIWRVFLAENRTEPGIVSHLADGVFGLLRRFSIELGSLPNVAPHGGPARWEVEGGLTEAMRQVTLADPRRGYEELSRWLLSGRKPRRQLARRTLRALCETYSRTRSRPSEEHLGSLLSLVAPLLGTPNDTSTADVVLLTLRSWSTELGAAERIGTELLRLATTSAPVVGERLRLALTRLWLEPWPQDAAAVARRLVRRPAKGGEGQLDARQRRDVDHLLTFWCQGSEAEARWIARAVIARTYAVAGALPSLPTMERAVAVVDPELLRHHESAASDKPRGALWRLLALLESRFELTFLRLGETASTPLSDEALAPVSLAPDFPSHRLLLPGLSKLAAGGAAQLFLFAARPPHDIDDLPTLHWVQRVCCIGPSFDAAATADGDAQLGLPWPPTPAQLDQVERALESRFARTLASAPPALWLELLRGCGIEPGDQQTMLKQLAAWADAVDALPSRDGHALDPVWKSVVLLLFLHARDAEGTLATIGTWLARVDDEPPAPARRVVSRAAALALIRLATSYPVGDASTFRPSTRLFGLLADPLARQGAEGVAAIVRLVTHWLDDPLWAKYLAGDVREGQGRLERWAATNLVTDPALAERLAQRLAAARANLVGDEGWLALVAATDRLRMRQALEHPRNLPELGPGQQYAVLVVDTAGGDGRRQRHLAALAAALGVTLPRASGESLVPAIYRLGESRPFWTTATEGPAFERLMPAGVHLPPLIGRVLEGLDCARVNVVLVLSGAPPTDLEDYLATGWWSKVRLYSAGESPPIATFTTLPPPLLESEPGTALELEQETRRLATLLAATGTAEQRPTAAAG